MAVVAALSAVIGTVVAVNVAQAADGPTFVVNSLGTRENLTYTEICDTGRKVTLKDGSTAAECTLTAAITAANSNGNKNIIALHSDFSADTTNIISITGSSTRMYSSALSAAGTGVAGSIGGDDSAIFHITRPVVIDFEKRVKIQSPANVDLDFALFYIDGPDVTIKGIDDWWSPETTFYISPKGRNTTIEDGKVTTANYYPERFAVIRGGSQNTTIKDLVLSGYASNDTDWGPVMTDGTSATTPVSGLTVQNVTMNEHPNGMLSCSDSSSSGCGSALVRVNSGVHVNDLVLKGNTSTNLNRASSYASRFFNLAGLKSNSVTITGNTFTNPQTANNRPLIDVRNAVVTKAKDANWSPVGGSLNLGEVVISDNTTTDITLSGSTPSSWVVFQGATIPKVTIRGNTVTGASFPGDAAFADFDSAASIDAVTIDANSLQPGASGRVAFGNGNSAWVRFQGAKVDTLSITGNTIANTDIGASSDRGGTLINLGGRDSNRPQNVFIENNVMTGISTPDVEAQGVIRLPIERGVTSAVIRGNTMTANSGKMAAIHWWGPTGSDSLSVAPSNVVIEKNHFDGWGDTENRFGTIRLYHTGAVTVRGNTFGTDTTTPRRTVVEENSAGNGGDGGGWMNTMLSNLNYSANGKMNTWYPAVAVTPQTSGLATTSTQSAPITPKDGCVIPLEVAPPGDSQNFADLTSARYPVPPVTVDVYWTKEHTAEVYLGSYNVGPAGATVPPAVAAENLPYVSTSQNGRAILEVLLPTLPPADDPSYQDPSLQAVKQTLWNLLDDQGRPLEGATFPVDPDTGAVNGYLRIQTHDASANQGNNKGQTIASSQYSRVAQIGGECSPQLTVARSQDHYTSPTAPTSTSDTTKGRYLHFTLSSDVALDPVTVTPAAVTVKASADGNPTGQGILATDDPDFLVITPLKRAGCVVEAATDCVDPTRFDIAVKANDTGRVEVTVPAGHVKAANGLTAFASHGSDNWINFINPVIVDNPLFPLVLGDTYGESYTIRVAADAPPPTADLSLAATLVDQAGQVDATNPYALKLYPHNGTDQVLTACDFPCALTVPTPAGTTTSSLQVTVTANSDQAVTAGTWTYIDHRLTSDDPNYSGLTVRRVTPRLYWTNPIIKIEKTAYFNVVQVAAVCGSEPDPACVNTAANLLAQPDANRLQSNSHIPSGTKVWFLYTVSNISADDWASTLRDIEVFDIGLSDQLDQTRAVKIGDIPPIKLGEPPVSLAYANNPVELQANADLIGNPLSTSGGR